MSRTWEIRLALSEQIDPVCINWEDIVERNYQVRVMGHIYSRATGVIARTDMDINPDEPAFTKLCTFQTQADMGKDASF